MEATDSDLRDRAVAQLKRKREFRGHLAVYVAVNALLWVIWIVDDERGGVIPWPLWVTVFWGLGVAIQAWNIYGGPREISETDVQEEMRRLQK